MIWTWGGKIIHFLLTEQQNKRYSMTKIAKFTLLAAGLTASVLLVSCKKKNIVFSGSSQTVDEKWDEKITTDVEITFNPNDYTFEEIEREYIEETDKEDDEIQETVFKRRGEYDGNPKKNGELILYYNGESVNGGSYNAYVEDVVFTVKKAGEVINLLRKYGIIILIFAVGIIIIVALIRRLL